MLGLLKTRPAPDLLVRERPPLPRDLTGLISQDTKQAVIAEYRSLADSIGVKHPHIEADLAIEDFKTFLRRKDWPVFSLATVVEYMDKKSAEESAAKAGWHWRPLREKDNIRNASFGKPARQWQGSEIVPASDHYAGPRKERQMAWSNQGQQQIEQLKEIAASALPYDKLVPLHALRKVAAVEKEFGKPVAFFVCDYAPAPHIEYPDPFLMAVIDHPRLGAGVGRFVIDFWDEPGFGLDEALK